MLRISNRKAKANASLCSLVLRISKVKAKKLTVGVHLC